VNKHEHTQGQAAKSGSVVLPLLAIFSLLAGLQAATQFFAALFNYDPALGARLGTFYAPWDILLWAQRWYTQYPEAVMKAAGIGLLVTVGGLFIAFAVKSVLANSARANATLHGSARWANKKDIQAAGLLPPAKTLRERLHPRVQRFSQKRRAFDWLNHSAAWLERKTRPPEKKSQPFVYVGGWQDKNGRFHYLRHSGPEHILTYAPTRSGKGVGLVVPTLLSWGQSAVITDLKGELWALTAGWREKHGNNAVLRFEPASSAPGAVRWNPLEEIRLNTKGEYEVGDVQNLATLIVDPDGKGLENHWQKTAFALLVGVILHALYQKDAGKLEQATLASIDKLLADPDRDDPSALWQEMVDNRHNSGNTRNDVVASAGRDMLARPKEEAGSVLSTAKSYLALYRDPTVARSISASDFRIRDLMHHERAVSLYIVTQPNDKGRLRPLVRILVNMIVRLLADKMDFKEGRPVAHYKHRLLMMLDEFPSLGRLEIMQESLAFVAGYGIKCYLICQDLNQLKSRDIGYGQDESITSNCHVQNAYPPNRLETAEHLSKLTGQTTVVKEQITTSGKRAALMMGQVSRTFQEVQRPLLTPDEAMRMKSPDKNAAGEILAPGDMVIYVAGFPAIHGKQPLYFTDPIFTRRAAIPAPDKSSDLSGNAPQNQQQQQAAPTENRQEQSSEEAQAKQATESSEPMEQPRTRSDQISLSKAGYFS